MRNIHRRIPERVYGGTSATPEVLPDRLPRRTENRGGVPASVYPH